MQHARKNSLTVTVCSLGNVCQWENLYKFGTYGDRTSIYKTRIIHYKSFIIKYLHELSG